MSAVDTTIVNVALYRLSHDFHSTVTQIQWVVTGYTLSLAAVIPISGWATRRFGAKNVYLTAVVLFTAGSALCGLATSSTELIVFRVLQGVGGGLILPVGQLMTAQAAGPKRMGRVMSVVLVPAVLAPALGPTIGGLIIQSTSWRWIFFVNLPIGLIALIAAVRTLPRSEPAPADRLDFVGLALMAAGLPLLTYGLAEIGEAGTFASSKVIVPCLIGLVLVVAFVRHALRTPRPLLQMHLYRRPTFAAASVAMFCQGGALFGGMILLPLYWQTVRHFSVIHTGLLLIPQGFGAGLAMPITGRLTERYGGGPMALFGVLLMTAATIPLALVGANTPVPWLLVVVTFRGFGVGAALMPAMTAAFASLRRSELSDATPQLNVLQRVGASIGTAVLAVVLQRALAGAHTAPAEASAFGIAFWAAAGLSAIAIVPCTVLLIAERRARAARLVHEAPDPTALVEAIA